MGLLNAVFLQLGTVGAAVLLGVFIAVIAGILAYFVVWALRKRPVTGSEALIGKLGFAMKELTAESDGEVSIDGVIWRARIGDGSKMISNNETVIVLGISSLTLLVGKKSS